MFCEQCGTELSEGAKFCPNCGTKCAVVVSSETAPVENPPKAEEIKSEEVKIEEAERAAVKVEESEVTPTAEVEPLKKQEPKKKSVLPIILSIVGGLVVLGGGVLLWLFKPWVISEDQTVSGNEIMIADTEDALKALTDFEKENRTDIDIEEEDYSIYEGLSLYPYRSDALDVYGMFMNPAEKDASLSWDGSMYNYLEEVDPNSSEDGQLANYKVEKKYYTGTGNGVREVCLTIYRHPETDIINKISCTEYHDGYEKYLNFIYLDDGTLNYANFSYGTVSDPELKKITGTYGFCFFVNDMMSQFLITESQDTFANIKLVEISGENPGEYCYYDSSESIQNSYDLAEKMYLNAGYNVLEAAEMDYSYGCMRGFVCDQYHDVITGANIDVYVAGTNYLVGSLETDLDGYATGISWLEEGYDLVITKDGYVGTILYDVVISPNHSEVVNDTAVLLKDAPAEAVVTINLYDDTDVAINEEDGTVTTKEVSPEEILVRRGKNNHFGKIYAKLTAENGVISTTLPSGIYTFEINADDYYTVFRTVELYGDVDYTLPMSAKLEGGQLKIVVSWQSDEDYDLSMFGSLSEGGSTCLTAGMGNDGNGASILYDGNENLHSEVILIDDYTKGNYRFYISDYESVAAGSNGAGNMKLSNMIVYVYDANGLVAVYEVPYTDGPVWEVFSVNAGEIKTAQRIYTDYTPNAIWGHKYSMEAEVMDALGYEYVEGEYYSGWEFTGNLGGYISYVLNWSDEKSGVDWLNNLCAGEEITNYLADADRPGETYVGPITTYDINGMIYVGEEDLKELSYSICGDESAMDDSYNDGYGYLACAWAGAIEGTYTQLTNPRVVYSDGLRCDVEFDTEVRVDTFDYYEGISSSYTYAGNCVRVHLIKDERSIFDGFRVTGAETVADPVDEVKDAEVGDTVTFGNFNGKDIEWVVLDKEDGEALLFSLSGWGISVVDDTYLMNGWKWSPIRNELGEKFSTVFSEAEQKKIIPTTSDMEFTGPVVDKLFLLSGDEWETYSEILHNGIYGTDAPWDGNYGPEGPYYGLPSNNFLLRSCERDSNLESSNTWLEIGKVEEDYTWWVFASSSQIMDYIEIDISPAIRVRYE